MTVCDRGRGSSACDVTLINFFIMHMNMMYSDRRGNGQTYPKQNLPDKRLREQLRENLYRGLLSEFFVLGQLKMGGSEMCDVLFWGVPGMCEKV